MLTLVTGTGYTGRRVLERLPVDAAMGLSRSPLATDRSFHLFDLDDGQPLPLKLPDDYAVVYTVAPAGTDTDARLTQFLEKLTPAPRRFVYISTTGVYGHCEGRRVTEDSPVNPGNARSAQRVAAEELLDRWAARENCGLVILRVPGIYGPERLGLDRIAAGAPMLREEDANPGNRIHVDDLASCCLRALSADVPPGVYNVGDGDHRSSTWFTAEVARQAGLPRPPTITRAEAAQQFSPMRLSFLSESRIVDTTRMRERLGVELRYARPEDGIRAAIACS